ncbi:MAG: hypothetical protein WD470_00890, partial [Rhodospirillaceae bacterium]
MEQPTQQSIGRLSGVRPCGRWGLPDRILSKKRTEKDLFRRLPTLSLALVLLAFAPQAAQAKYAAIVVDAESGRIIHAVNADTPNYPASLTKM